MGFGVIESFRERARSGARSHWLLFRLIGGFLFLNGCSHSPKTSSSVKFVDPDSAQTAKDASKLKIEKPMDVYVDAKPIEPLTMPIYPAPALKARAGEVQ